VLPSTIGGDVLRVSRAAKTTGTSDVAFASVVIERLSGFVALPLLSFVGFALEPSLLQFDRSWIAVMIAGATIGALVVVVLLAASPSIAGRFAGHQNWTRFIGRRPRGHRPHRREPRRAVRRAGRRDQATRSRSSPRCTAPSTPWGSRCRNGAVLAFLPAVAAAQALPISLSGLGIREGLLVILLHPLGVPTGKAVAIGLLWYGMTLVVSLLGAPAFAVGQRSSKSAKSAEHDGSSSMTTAS